MVKISQLDTHFSPEEQGRLAGFLNANPALTVDAFCDLLAEKGLDVSRSTGHTYQRKLSEMGSKLKQSRIATEALSRNLGDAQVEGEFGRVLIEIVRTLAFNVSLDGLDGGDAGLDPQQIAYLAKAQKDLAQALRLSQDFETRVAEIRAQAEKEALAAAAVVAGEAVTRAGISDEARRVIEEEILGLKR